jgi:lysophospholipase L1-like esterase
MMRTLLLFGDSNTHGTIPLLDLDGDSRFSRAERWAGRLARMLPDWDVINEGLPGRTTVHDDPIEGAHLNGLTVLPALLATHRPVDVVLIMLGTNDLKYRFSVNAADIALSVNKLIDAIKGSGAGPGGKSPQILVVSPPPILETGRLSEMFQGGAAKSLDLAKHLQVVAEAQAVPFVDAGTLIKVSVIDGIHYDADANPVLAEAFAKAIARHFPQ